MIRTLLAATLWLILSGCATGVALTPSDADSVLSQQLLDAPKPSLAGPMEVGTLYYGSGDDRRRAEYRDSVAIRTTPVDARKLVDLGGEAKERNRYWGFSPAEFPVNARVWYPKGDGRFPLVLIVHGNHNPRDFSDPGYEYLGELLASRGFILASVDMNFLNGRIREENDARAWMLLKHLAAWKSFSEDEENPFYGRVDMDRVALMGHSRGGEAVAVAAAFNSLPFYPDNASVAFDFNFGIQSVIAIAPVDGQYLPSGRGTPITDVNYLVFHGSHDGDVTSFHGLRQYGRVSFTPDSDRFKAAVYMYRANHGQWNSLWNNKDNGPRSGRILDLDKLIAPSEQREFGKLYVSAFLEATLHDRREYLPMFRDHRVIGEWLPKTMYVTRFQTGGFRALADFEDDIDLTTGSMDGVELRADSMETWRELRLALRSRNRANTSASQTNQTVLVGWNNQIGKTDSLGVPARYVVALPDGLSREMDVDSSWAVTFLMTATHDEPKPRSVGADSSVALGSRVDADSRSADSSTTRGKASGDPPEPMDLTLEVVDTGGRLARVPVSDYGPLRRPLRISVMRRKRLEKSRFEADHELVLQSFSVPIADLARLAPGFDPASIRELRFVFDRTAAGTVILDDIGLTKLDPAFY